MAAKMAMPNVYMFMFAISSCHELYIVITGHANNMQALKMKRNSPVAVLRGGGGRVSSDIAVDQTLVVEQHHNQGYNRTCSSLIWNGLAHCRASSFGEYHRSDCQTVRLSEPPGCRRITPTSLSNPASRFPSEENAGKQGDGELG